MASFPTTCIPEGRLERTFLLKMISADRLKNHHEEALRLGGELQTAPRFPASASPGGTVEPTSEADPREEGGASRPLQRPLLLELVVAVVLVLDHT